MSILLGVFGWRLSETMKREEDRDSATVSIVWESTNIALPVLALFFTGYEVFRYVSQTLTPWTMLFTNIVKVTCSVGAVILDVYVYVIQRPGHYYAVAGLVLDSIFITLIPAVYSIRIYTRSVGFDEHLITASTRPVGFRSSMAGLEGYDTRNSSSTSFKSTRKSLAVSLLSISTHRSSGGSFASLPTTADHDDCELSPRQSTPTITTDYRPCSPSQAAIKSPMILATPYSHQRATDFDEYLASRDLVQKKKQPLPRASRKDTRRASMGSIPLKSPLSSHVMMACSTRRASSGAVMTLGIVPEEVETSKVVDNDQREIKAKTQNNKDATFKDTKNQQSTERLTEINL
ncbi:hypothetical protein BROUX41_000383 [Berkeleyomyces rouxiae]